MLTIRSNGTCGITPVKSNDYYFSEACYELYVVSALPINIISVLQTLTMRKQAVKTDRYAFYVTIQDNIFLDFIFFFFLWVAPHTTNTWPPVVNASR